MTIANDIIFLSLRNAGVVGVGQTPLADDTNDAFTILNAWIAELNLERTVQVNRVVLPTFPDLTTDVPFWDNFEHVLLTSMAVRLRQIYSLPPIDLDVKLALSALQAFNAINLQQIAAPSIAADDGTGYGIIFLALRAAGRVKDDQGVSQTSQDVTDAQSLMNEMLDEWQQMRTVKVIPGTLPVITDLTAPLALTTGVRSAIVLNLAVRLRDAFGAEVSKTLADRAAMTLELIQAINQQQIAPLVPGIPETVEQAIFLALRLAGRITDQQSVSQTSKDVNDAFALLVMMLAQWQRKRWLIWNEQEVSLTSTGAYSYSIGPGQDFDTPRPDKIHAAWVRLNSGTFGAQLAALLPFPLGEQASPYPVDLPLQIIEAKEDWARITIKDLGSIPAAVFYDSAFPVGQLYFWPVPIAAQYQMHLIVKASLPVYVSITDPMGLPPEYVDALVNSLACRIVVASGGQISPFLLGQTRASMETIRLANSQIGQLGMPAALLGRRGSDASSWAGAGLNQAWTVSGPSVLS
jgi:hypothetical protein